MDVAKQGSRELSLTPSLKTLAQGSMFWQPDHLAPSPWLEHLPLLFWLVEALQPEQSVILGDAEGGAHLGICQALSRLGLNASCYLVAEGEAPNRVQEEARRRYGGLAQRLATTSLRALGQFEPARTDLLVVSAAWDDTGVEEIIERWRSRLSSRGVVAMVGIARREPGCDLFRAYDSLKQQAPHVTFPHGDGLGLLMLGSDVPPLLERLLTTWEMPQSARVVQDVFARLGRGCLDQLVAERERCRTGELSEQLEELSQRITGEGEAKAQLEQELQARSRELERATQQLALLEERHAHERGHLAEQVSQLQESRAGLTRELQAVKHRQEAQSEEAVQQAAELASLRAERQLHGEQLKRLEETSEARSELAQQSHRFELDRLQGELARQAEALTEASRVRDALNQKLKRNGEEKRALEQQLQQREHALVKAQEQAGSLQQRLEREQGERAKREAELQAEVQDAQRECEQLRDAAERQMVEKAELGQQLSQLQGTLDAERSERGRLQAKWQQTLDEKDAAIATRFEELATLTKMLEEADAEKRQLQARLEAAAKESKRNDRALTAQQEEQKAALERQVAELKDTLNAERRERNTLQAELQHRIQEKEKEVETRFEELAVLTQMLEEKDQQLAKLGGEAPGEVHQPDRAARMLPSVLTGALGKQHRAARKLKKDAKEIESSGYFNKSWYLQRYPDVAGDARFKSRPALHYLKFGGFEGRSPGPDFDSQWYLDENPDVAVSGINPLLHYVRYGKQEGRSPLPDATRE
ncbi:hypothetical protein [Halomonas sp. BM-2019]|uniref:hypothetical protein n=1 Tax=Halomonas sp. BM-2019 TaxID=2811227 RepID=UPI001B3C44FB|nr:MAG: hypothetical protein J5F18_11265 [Halomonas sp. BM-2019]